MAERYYLNENGQRTGPFTNQELERRYRSAEIDGDTLCWPDEFFNFGWKTLRTFFAHFRSPAQEWQQQEPGRQEDERQARERQEYEHREQQGRERARQEQQRREHERQNRAVVFECVDCGTGIRLQLQQGQGVYRCPSCKTEYKTIQGDGEQSVLLVVPTSLRRGQSSDTASKRKKTIPPDVRSSLVAFALGEESTFDDVRRAYREHVQQYHPDKVAHLGPELRKLAEIKTKEFNAAYQILERFYAV